MKNTIKALSLEGKIYRVLEVTKTKVFVQCYDGSKRTLERNNTKIGDITIAAWNALVNLEKKRIEANVDRLIEEVAGPEIIKVLRDAKLL